MFSCNQGVKLNSYYKKKYNRNQTLSNKIMIILKILKTRKSKKIKRKITSNNNNN